MQKLTKRFFEFFLNRAVILLPLKPEKA